MKTLVLIILISLSLGANMFDEMGEQFVKQVENMTDTSSLNNVKIETAEEKKVRLERKDRKKQRELKRLKENQVRMYGNLEKNIQAKEERRAEAGNSYLGITMNTLTSVEHDTKYLGFDRRWEKRSTSNLVGIISLSGIVTEVEVMKFQRSLHSKYKFVKTKSFKTTKAATNQYIYTNQGDLIVFNVQTTEFKNPVRYKILIKYVYKDEVNN
ncbi:MAG: hypothetical protein Q9M32_05770 [Sulfurimonas sp.]|nr:hypothetical protein [Sulfurimonas sp.]MDQ7060068.1 hypothetical protein [Sulfurimonas sp.]